MEKRVSPGLILLVLAAGCATRGPETPVVPAATEAEHRALAQRHAWAANVEQSKYDPRAIVTKRTGPSPTRGDDTRMEREVNPTQKHLRRARRERALAEAHANAAARIESFDDAACTSTPAAVRAACPLITDASVEDIPGGVRIHVADDREGTLERVRCHLAFARSRQPGPDDCPLYVEGARAAPHGEDALDMTTDRPALVSELRRRAREHVSP